MEAKAGARALPTSSSRPLVGGHSRCSLFLRPCRGSPDDACSFLAPGARPCRCRPRARRSLPPRRAVLRPQQGPVRDVRLPDPAVRALRLPLLPGRVARHVRRGAHGASAGTRACPTSSGTRSTASRSSSTPTIPTSSRPTSSSGAIGEGTGGVTEGLRTRVVMPFTGSYGDTTTCSATRSCTCSSTTSRRRVPAGIQRLDTLPLWLIEGMAEYLSLGRDDPLTAMWLRDAVRRDDLPDDQAARPRPALLPVPLRPGAVGVRRRTLGRPRGGRRLPRRAALRLGPGASAASSASTATRCRKDWIAAIARDVPAAAWRGGTHPDSVGQHVVGASERSGDYNVSPVRSAPTAATSRSSRAATCSASTCSWPTRRRARVIKQLAAPTRDAHFDAISFIHSAGDWSPDGRQFAFVAYRRGRPRDRRCSTCAAADVERRVQVAGRRRGERARPGRPDGRTIAFSGTAGGISDLYVFDLATGRVDAADERPLRRPAARVVARRPHARLRDRPRRRAPTSRR